MCELLILITCLSFFLCHGRSQPLPKRSNLLAGCRLLNLSSCVYIGLYYLFITRPRQWRTHASIYYFILSITGNFFSLLLIVSSQEIAILWYLLLIVYVYVVAFFLFYGVSNSLTRVPGCLFLVMHGTHVICEITICLHLFICLAPIPIVTIPYLETPSLLHVTLVGSPSIRTVENFPAHLLLIRLK